MLTAGTHQEVLWLLVVLKWMMLCEQGRSGKLKPWLLEELIDVVVAPDVTPEQLMQRRISAKRTSSAGEEEVKFGVQPPMDVDINSLLNLRVLPMEEEFWIELPSSAKAYEIDEQVGTLAEASTPKRQVSRLSSAADAELMEGLVRKLRAARQGPREPAKRRRNRSRHGSYQPE